MAARRTGLLLVLGLLGAGSCMGDGIRRFPLRDPLWVDPDVGPIANKPAKRPTRGYDGMADNTVFWPVARALALPLATDAINVNSLDEVPNSSFFTNRIGMFPMTPDEVARGACRDTPPLDPSRGPWIISSGKTDGTHPGFVIKAPDGARYLLKFDGPLMSQRATAADVVGSLIYYAAGFFTPCNQIVAFPDEILQLAPTAKHKDDYGRDVPLTQADVQQMLTAGWRTPAGLVRASASRYLPGEPLGPFSYEGVRADDPNDVIPHERRRELRGSMLLAAWIHHWDALENNTLDTLVEEGGRRFVRHHILDWGDALGDVWTWNWRRFNQRIGTGRSGYLDLDYAFADLFTLGLLPRPWYHAAQPPQPETFGYFDSESFAPSAWRGTYPNPAFRAMTPRDALWATRIIARFTDADIDAIVARARIDDPAATRYLIDTLIARRDRILREYLTRLSPLDRFTLSRRGGAGTPQTLCFEDLAIATRVAAPQSTMYRIQLRGGAQLDQLLGWRQLRPDPDHPARTCVELPFGHLRPETLAGPTAPDDDPRRYAIMEIDNNQQPSLQASATVRLHLFDLGGARGFRLVGIERPERVTDPP
jgi:hypothetical protein